MRCLSLILPVVVLSDSLRGLLEQSEAKPVQLPAEPPTTDSPDPSAPGIEPKLSQPFCAFLEDDEETGVFGRPFTPVSVGGVRRRTRRRTRRRVCYATSCLYMQIQEEPAKTKIVTVPSKSAVYGTVAGTTLTLGDANAQDGEVEIDELKTDKDDEKDEAGKKDDIDGQEGSGPCGECREDETCMRRDGDSKLQKFEDGKWQDAGEAASDGFIVDLVTEDDSSVDAPAQDKPKRNLRVGNPATPVSVAGTRRRTRRRTCAATECLDDVEDDQSQNYL